MSKSKINKIELTSFEIELIDIEENKSGIGIFYSPNSKKKHIRFGIRIPISDDLLSPFLLTVPLQLLAYHVALLKNCDIDKPRNLAKSVTVE